jgi:serine/threonine-protein kinase Chk2
MAPELFLGRTESTPKIDVWSLGCILHAMILGEYPFADQDKEELKKQILKRKICVSCKSNSTLLKQTPSRDVLDLIDKMLIKEPESRYSVIDVLRHPWMSFTSEFDETELFTV